MPETVILRVLMHCEGCANIVKRACARIPGVAKYTVDYPAQRVTVTGEVNREQVLKRILRTGKLAELEPEKPQKQGDEKKEKQRIQVKKEKVQIQAEADPTRDPLYPVTMVEAETAVIQTVILNVVLHCEGCARTVKKAVKRIPGVTAYDVDFPGQKVTVTGVVTPEDVYRHVSRTGKITVLVPPPPPPPPPPPEESPKPAAEEPTKPAAEAKPAEDAKPDEAKPEDAAAAPAATAEEKPNQEDPKPEKPNEDEAKPTEAAPPPAAEAKPPEEAKPEEAAKPDETTGAAAAAPAADEKKPDEAKPAAEPPPAVPAPEPQPLPQEELFPVTFVIDTDYTRYYYYED